MFRGGTCGPTSNKSEDLKARDLVLTISFKVQCNILSIN